MDFRIVSDLHLNFSKGYTLERTPLEEETVLIVAGDLVELGFELKHYAETFFEEHSRRFKHIIYVLGNHCYWGCDLKGAIARARTMVESYENVTVLDNDLWVDDNEKVMVFGATMWTSLNKGDPLTVYRCKNYMNDFWEVSDLSPRQWQMEHIYSTYMIDRYLDPEYYPVYKDYKKVIVTHHAPHGQSIGTKYRGPEYGDVNYAYYTDLTDLIEKRKPNLWIHGHIHEAQDYKVGDTRIIVNPRGYTRVKEGWAGDSGFKPKLVIEV